MDVKNIKYTLEYKIHSRIENTYQNRKYTPDYKIHTKNSWQ